MLVLSRKEGEKLVIGNNIVITVNRIAGNRVALGIDAPREISIVRGELDIHECAPRSTEESSGHLSKRGGSPNSASMMNDGIAVASQPER
ncbi:MAG: carbon storage regulator [Planctomycetota bacterium]